MIETDTHMSLVGFLLKAYIENLEPRNFDEKIREPGPSLDRFGKRGAGA